MHFEFIFYPPDFLSSFLAHLLHFSHDSIKFAVDTVHVSVEYLFTHINL